MNAALWESGDADTGGALTVPFVLHSLDSSTGLDTRVATFTGQSLKRPAFFFFFLKSLRNFAGMLLNSLGVLLPADRACVGGGTSRSQCEIRGDVAEVTEGRRRPGDALAFIWRRVLPLRT